MAVVNRKALNTTVDKNLVALFDTFAKNTRIAKSKLMDEALEDLLKKYGIELNKANGEPK